MESEAIANDLCEPPFLNDGLCHRRLCVTECNTSEYLVLMSMLIKASLASPSGTQQGRSDASDEGTWILTSASAGLTIYCQSHLV